MRELFRELRQELAGLVLPESCAGCGVPDVRDRLCQECGDRLRSAVPRRVWPTPVPPGLPAVYGALAYGDEARAVLLAHKERGALRLVTPLGVVLAGAVRAAVAAAQGRGPVTLVPVPSARWAVRRRGHDPVRRIAAAAARELRRHGVSAGVLGVLRQCRAVADQSGLSAGQRLANLRGALEAGGRGGAPPVEGRTVLVDDLMTTGASLAEAARAVRSAGWRVDGAAVVAFRRRG